MKARREATEAYPGRTETRIETSQEPLEAEIKTGLKKVKATILKANLEEEEEEVKENVTEHQKYLRKRQQWKLPEHCSIDIGTRI
jgi:hypothetical protein